MAKFLTTQKIVSKLEDLIKDADKTLYLISPYLNLTKNFQELINSRNRKGKETIIIYRENKLSSEQLKFLTDLQNVKLKYHEDLHAKCYFNDTKLIITSLNLYEYSIINNKEMGVLYDSTLSEDIEIYKEAVEYVKFIEENGGSQNPNSTKKATIELKTKHSKDSCVKSDKHYKGYCIRTGDEIPFNIEKPMGYEAFKEWNKYANVDYAEKYCHFSGEKSDGQTSVSKPILNKNWKKAKEIHGL